MKASYHGAEDRGVMDVKAGGGGIPVVKHFLERARILGF